MPENNCQKIKLLKIIEMLRQETDEQPPIATHEMCQRLASMNITCDRRTLGRDISTLNKQGYEVMFTWQGREKAYYVEDRGFSVPELKILIDAVQAASFITKKKSSEPIENWPIWAAATVRRYARATRFASTRASTAMKRSTITLNICGRCLILATRMKDNDWPYRQ